MGLRQIIKAFFKKIVLKDTGRRAIYLMRYHDPGELPMRFSKEDYVPLALAIVRTILGMAAIGLLLYLIIYLLRR